MQSSLCEQETVVGPGGCHFSLTIVPQQRGFLRPGIQAGGGGGSVPSVEMRASDLPVYNILDTQILMSSPASREDISARWVGREKEP